MIAGLLPGAWLTLANYAAAFALCLVAAHRARRSRRAWTALSAVVLVLLVNKAFALDAMLAGLGRSLAKADGVYDGRRPFQLAAILVLLGLLPYGLRWARQRIDRRDLPLQLAALCVMALAAFVAARALSFHYLDKLLALGPGFIKLNGLIENAVVCGIVTGALLAVRSRRRTVRLRASLF